MIRFDPTAIGRLEIGEDGKPKIVIDVDPKEFDQLGLDLLEHSLKHFERAGIDVSNVRASIEGGSPIWATYWALSVAREHAGLVITHAESAAISKTMSEYGKLKSPNKVQRDEKIRQDKLMHPELTNAQLGDRYNLTQRTISRVLNPK